MENNLTLLHLDREKPLDAWVDEVIKPILAVIGNISSQLNNLLREIY